MGALGAFMILFCGLSGVSAVAQIFARFLPELTIGSDGVTFKCRASPGPTFVPWDKLGSVSLVKRDRPKLPGSWAIDLSFVGAGSIQLAIFPAAQADHLHSAVASLRSA